MNETTCNVSRETQPTDEKETDDMNTNQPEVKEVNTIPVFVYGSLRPGAAGANDAMVNASVLGPWSAVTVGQLYRHECGAYPVLCAGLPGEDVGGTVGGGTVVGDVYLIDEDHADWLWLYQMETRAGYRAVWKDCGVQQTTGEWRTLKCITFQWDWAERGEIVENGDWLTVDAAAWPRATR